MGPASDNAGYAQAGETLQPQSHRASMGPASDNAGYGACLSGVRRRTEEGFNGSGVG